MADLRIDSLRGGVNSADAETALAPDTCTVAENIEFRTSTCGERRRGSVPVEAGVLASAGAVPFVARAGADLWALGRSVTPELTLLRRNGGDETVSIPDSPDPMRGEAWQAVQFAGKTFVVYPSAVDRLHVWDGTLLRRCGLRQPDPPTAQDDGSGTYSGVRHYRVRFIEMAGATVVRRSEPSEALTFTPSGSGAGVEITMPALINEGENAYEIEASLDGSTWYLLQRLTLASPTYVDTVPFESGYQDLPGAVQSEPLDAYALIPSVRFLTVHQDRLFLAGHCTNANVDSRVMWTPVSASKGDGNSERVDASIDSFKDLDQGENGGITGVSASIDDVLHLFKRAGIYRLIRTGQLEAAYEAICLTKERGAIEGSVVNGVNERGGAITFFVDPRVGPCAIDSEGPIDAGYDILPLITPYLNEPSLHIRGVYYPAAYQVIWYLSTDEESLPPRRLVLHTRELRRGQHGLRGGWTVATGPAVLGVTLHDGKPLTSGSSDPALLRIEDTGHTDCGVPYRARIVTGAVTPTSWLDQFGIRAGGILTQADPDVQVVLTARAATSDDDTITKTQTLSLPNRHAVVLADALAVSEMYHLQIEIADPESGGSGWWALNGVLGRLTKGQTS